MQKCLIYLFITLGILSTLGITQSSKGETLRPLKVPDITIDHVPAPLAPPPIPSNFYSMEDSLMSAPIQEDLSQTEKIPFLDGHLTLTAKYDITARVLARKTYSLDKESSMSPIDLALGWKEMSEYSNINRLSITQNERFYYYRWGNEGPPVHPDTIVRTSANVHMIPSNDKIERALKRAKVGQVVRIKGYLVNYYEEFPSGEWWGWNSSMTRNDTGKGACEVLYVKEVELY